MKTVRTNNSLQEHTRYLKLKQDDEGMFVMHSPKAFSVLINNQLVSIDKRYVKYGLDSLKSVYTFPIAISLFSETGLNELSAAVIMPQIKSGQENSIKNVEGSSILLACFILFWILVFLVYSQRSVTMEYFKWSTLFSIRNQEDNIQTQRVTSFSNLFVYIFCSILMGINLISVELNPFLSAQFTAVNILIVAVAVLVLLFFKILIVSTTAYFFGISESAPSQFFNFVKLLLLCFSLSSICLIIDFILNFEENLLMGILRTLVITILAAYLIVTFLRLNNKGESTVFHLFSYLCISEIFPVLLLLKIYYF